MAGPPKHASFANLVLYFPGLMSREALKVLTQQLWSTFNGI